MFIKAEEFGVQINWNIFKGKFPKKKGEGNMANNNSNTKYK